MARRGGVHPFTFQGMRRLSAQEYEKARAGCGPLILGHGYGGADRFYLRPFDALREALPALRVPAGMQAEQAAPAEPEGFWTTVIDVGVN